MVLMFVYYYGGKVPYMLLYTVLTLPIVSFSNLVFGYFGFKYLQELERNSVEKGEKVKYILTVINNGLFLLPYVNIELHDSANNKSQKASSKNVFIPPFSKRRFKLEYIYKYRGEFQVGVKTIEMRDFLGIFKLRYKAKKPLKVKVYPRVINIERFYVREDMHAYNSLNHKGIYEDTSVVDEINKYNYGDSLNRVHWKLTAKMNEMMVKKFEGTEAQNLLFIFDLKKNSYKEETNNLIEDKQIEASIGVLKYLIDTSAEVKFSYYDKKIVNLECRSPMDFENLYRFFSTVKFNQDINIEDIITLMVDENVNMQNILIATSNISYALYEVLYKVKTASNNIGLIYVSPKEIEGESDDISGILKGIKEIGISLYYINITSDIKTVLENGGDIIYEKI